MKSGRTLVELATELERQSKSKKDYIADTRRLSLKATPDASAPIIMDGVNGGMPLQCWHLCHDLLCHARGDTAPREEVPPRDRGQAGAYTQGSGA